MKAIDSIYFICTTIIVVTILWIHFLREPVKHREYPLPKIICIDGIKYKLEYDGDSSPLVYFDKEIFSFVHKICDCEKFDGIVVK